MRSILSSNGHLLPEDLRSHARALVAHYDVWLRRFDAKVEIEEPAADAFFDVVFAELPFPEESAKASQDSYLNLWRKGRPDDIGGMISFLLSAENGQA